MPITTHETPGPLDLDIRVQAGRVDIETADTAETTVEIEALSGGDAGQAAVESARQELRSVGDGYRLVIEIPKRPRLFGWNEPEVLVRVQCPHGSAVVAKTASADLELRGRAGDFSTKTASGDVTVEAASRRRRHQDRLGRRRDRRRRRARGREHDVGRHRDRRGVGVGLGAHDVGRPAD